MAHAGDAYLNCCHEPQETGKLECKKPANWNVRNDVQRNNK